MILILCAIFLQIAWVAYFKSETRELDGRKPLEGSKICCY